MSVSRVDTAPVDTALVGIVYRSDPAGLRRTVRAWRAAGCRDDRIVLVADRPDAEVRAVVDADIDDDLDDDLGGLSTHRRPPSRAATGSVGGRAAAFNRLLRAGVDLDVTAFVFVESGSVPAPAALRRLVAALNEPGVGLAGPTLDRAWNAQRLDASAVRAPLDEPAAIEHELTHRHGDEIVSLAPLYSIAEPCFAVSARTVDAVGDADEGFGTGPCWEMEYAARAVRAGWSTVWVRSAYVHLAAEEPAHARDVSLGLPDAKRRYQDRLCGLRLGGLRRGYGDHCHGDSCEHFAPPDRIVVRLPTGRATARRGPTPTTVGAPRPSTIRARPESVDSRRPPVPSTDTLVSCIMPTADRPEWVAQSIRMFLGQHHRRTELIIVDDGDQPLDARLVGDLDHPRVQHVRLRARASIGTKRNLAVERARGDVIVQWDDDDWYGPDRIDRQIGPILCGEADITGFDRAVWFDIDAWTFHRPRTRLHRDLFVGDVHGGTLAFGRRVWDGSRVRYPDASLAEDAALLRAALAAGFRLRRLHADASFLYVRHGTNSWAISGPHPTGPGRTSAAIRSGRSQNGGAGCGWEQVAEPEWLGADRAFYRRRPPQTRSAPASRSARSSNSSVAPCSAAEPHASLPVTCIVPTADRPRFIAAAVAGALAQHYEPIEVVVVDNGQRPIAHLLPDDARVRYVRADPGLALGTVRNLAVQHGIGDIVVHIDDDDWSHPDRVAAQVAELHHSGADVCGLATLLWWDPDGGTAWRYTCPRLHRPWVAGNTLAYRRATWERSPFPPQAVGEDTAFVWGLADRRVAVLDDERLVVGRLHDANTSTKRTTSSAWTPVESAHVRRMVAGMHRDTTPPPCLA